MKDRKTSASWASYLKDQGTSYFETQSVENALSFIWCVIIKKGTQVLIFLTLFVWVFLFPFVYRNGDPFVHHGLSRAWTLHLSVLEGMDLPLHQMWFCCCIEIIMEMLYFPLNHSSGLVLADLSKKVILANILQFVLSCQINMEKMWCCLQCLRASWLSPCCYNSATFGFHSWNFNGYDDVQDAISLDLSSAWFWNKRCNSAW